MSTNHSDLNGILQQLYLRMTRLRSQTINLIQSFYRTTTEQQSTTTAIHSFEYFLSLKVMSELSGALDVLQSDGGPGATHRNIGAAYLLPTIYKILDHLKKILEDCQEAQNRATSNNQDRPDGKRGRRQRGTGQGQSRQTETQVTQPQTAPRPPAPAEALSWCHPLAYHVYFSVKSRYVSF